MSLPCNTTPGSTDGGQEVVFASRNSLNFVDVLSYFE